MTYINWANEEVFINTLQWIKVSDFIRYLHELIDFIINSSDKKCSQRHIPQTTYEETPPINETDRFPKFEAFLCCGYGKWKIELDLLQLSINIMMNSNRLLRQYPDYNTDGEVEIYAISKIHHLLELAQEEYLQQFSFEHHFDLNWED